MKKNILYVGSQRNDDEPEITIRNAYPDVIIHFFGLAKKSFNTRTNRIAFDIEAYTEKAREYIRKNNIDGVYFSTDLGSLIGAILCKEFGFPGPSLTSVFHSFHKLYTRKILPAPNGYSIYRIEDEFPAQTEYPIYIKAPYSAAGVLGFTIHSKLELLALIPLIKKELPKMNKAINVFLSAYLPISMHPEAFDNIMIIEKYINAPQVTIEGYVHNGTVSFTVITDTNFYKNTRLIDNFSLPTSLSADNIKILQEQAKKDIATIGIDNCFFNSEYWLTENRYTLIEVNCRAASCFEYLYKNIYNYDVTRAGIELCLGKKPKEIGEAIGIGGQFNVVTTYEGISSDVFDYTYSSPSKLSIKRPQHTLISNISDFGTVLAQFELIGDSYQEIKTVADEYRKKSLKKSN